MTKSEVISISNNIEEIAKIENLVAPYCVKHRIYDEYYGIIIRALDIVLRKIISANNGKEGKIHITQQTERERVIYNIESTENLAVLFEKDENEADIQSLELLITDFVVMDTNSALITFNINALHRKEWVRRSELMNKYFIKSHKHA